MTKRAPFSETLLRVNEIDWHLGHPGSQNTCLTVWEWASRVTEGWWHCTKYELICKWMGWIGCKSCLCINLVSSIAETGNDRNALWWPIVMRGEEGTWRVASQVMLRVSVTFVGALLVPLLQPVACGWEDIMRTTTPTTPNPDKPGTNLISSSWGTHSLQPEKWGL